MHISQQLLKFIPLPLQVVALLGLPPHFCLTLFFSFLSIYKPFVMHMTLNLSFCPNLFIHTPYWPTSQKPNTTIQAPVSSSRIPFFLSWAGGIHSLILFFFFTPSFFSPWPLIIFMSSTDSRWEDSFSVLPSTSNASQLQQLDLHFLQQSPSGLLWWFHQTRSLSCSLPGQLVGTVWISFVHILLNFSIYLYCHSLKFNWPETRHTSPTDKKYSTFIGTISATGTSFIILWPGLEP